MGPELPRSIDLAGNKEKGSPPAPKKPQVRVAKSVYRKHVLKKIGLGALYSGLIFIIIYGCFAATIIRVIPATKGMSPIVVKNQTFPGGIAPEGAVIVINTEGKVGTGSFDRLKQAFTPSDNVAVVEVLAGPAGRITWAPSGLITIDGNPMKITVKDDPKDDFLRDQYLVRCLEGDCEIDSGFIIADDQVYGEPISKKGD
jgi:hypothetical protein